MGKYRLIIRQVEAGYAAYVWSLEHCHDKSRSVISPKWHSTPEECLVEAKQRREELERIEEAVA